jgi:hypothetical protein
MNGSPAAQASEATGQMDAFEVMRRGVPMSKNGNTWTHYDFRMFQLTDSQDAVVWTKKSAGAEERIPIRSIQRIHEGQSTKTFQKDAKKGLEHLSFSIVWTNAQGEEETLDLICCRESDAVCWVKGIRTLLENGYGASCMVAVPEAKVDTSLSALLHRTKSQQAGRMAWAIPLAIVPIAGIAWLGYTAYYRNQDFKDIVSSRLPEIKTLIASIEAILQRKAIKGNAFVEQDAPLRLEFIGQCYEAAANIKDSVLKDTLNAQLHNVAVGLAEAQALHQKLQILEAEANKGKTWSDTLTNLNPWAATNGQEDEDTPSRDHSLRPGSMGMNSDGRPQVDVHEL